MTLTFSQIGNDINGKAETYSTVELFLGASSLERTTAYGNYDCSFSPGSALSTGSHSITAQAIDAADNTSSTSSSLSMS
tara:strand:- start:333 stop:569 length:237 start_codon:yes stop_codon:yes gene_type:complete